jgi:hypothetical protein
MGAVADDRCHRSYAAWLTRVAAVAILFLLHPVGARCCMPRADEKRMGGSDRRRGRRAPASAATGVADGEPAVWEAVLRGWSLARSWRVPAAPLLLFPAG